ncbi:MAG: class I SAM-dependent methyltransferase [Bacteroidota bacterium]|nr:class I SAM-dependent methyltransferase [Bacteroidota bacterium]
MATFTTEITSDSIASDNPIHQRLLKPYYLVQPHIKGDFLEVGCGEGRGIELLAPLSNSYLALDKITEVIESLTARHENVTFKQAIVPPFKNIEDNSFDVVISFQVIEHIQDDKFFLQEIYRVLKPGGKVFLTTPNIKKTLTRNPWHIREYTAPELTKLLNSIFPKVEMKGIAGNDKVMAYYHQNKQAVEKITRFDIFNLQYKLPASLLKIPYDFLNRLNRNNLKDKNSHLVHNINHEDYLLSENPEDSLDLFCMAEK